MLKRKELRSSLRNDEYSVYVFFNQDNKKLEKQPNSWERARSTRYKLLALQKAKRLYDSKQYERIVVKRKFFDVKKGCDRGVVLRTFNKDKRKFSLPENLVVPLIVLSVLGVVFIGLHAVEHALF